MFIWRQWSLVGHCMLAFLVIFPTRLRGLLYLIETWVHLTSPFFSEVGGQDRAGEIGHPWRPAVNRRDRPRNGGGNNVPPMRSRRRRPKRNRPPSGLADALKKLTMLGNNFINLGPSRITLIQSIFVRQETDQLSQQIPQDENKWLPDTSVGTEETHTDILAKRIFIRLEEPVPGINLSPLNTLTIVGVVSIRVTRL